ncbi:oxygenase MpaB family protein [Streptomonospora nanhaiensis]|uniref:Uncharacterized protein (DUF2236 family) n=1 Tax=Streptomonospora nanhaiensis TaxID=1323731 RepID=A0A853BLR5_9ACTN|nr:oxygenase MpaB family protein [Streptomonospora nanhaiensis]MBV2363295.1 DUF2236 domain-containing protein [Streptomonospora nanhaiensis]MBX9390902.1 DUF2236 domain-containing protein [Streptomonospora nanhaiensis]NYI95655.1 uncharacterized protein (DUF2236 family) [Streptomonospora nanhaiensis]
MHTPSDLALPAAHRVFGEAVLLGGAGTAVLLQIAHPSVAQGVADHSDFAHRPLDRLRGTLVFVYTQMFGTPEEADRVARIVRAIHTRVTGPGYDARDPDLQVWVAATLYHCNLRLYEMVFGPLPEADRDDVYRRSAVFATSLGCPADRWPATRADFDAYWAGAVARLAVSDAARGTARTLFAPPNRALRPLTAAQRFLTAGLLPEDVRRQYGLEWDPARQRRFDRLVRLVRAWYPRLPRAVRTLPRDAYLWDMRRRGGWKRRPPNRGAARAAARRRRAAEQGRAA